MKRREKKKLVVCNIKNEEDNAKDGRPKKNDDEKQKSVMKACGL